MRRLRTALRASFRAALGHAPQKHCHPRHPGPQVPLLSPLFSVLSPIFSALSHNSTILSTQHSALSSQPPPSTLNPPPSRLPSQVSRLWIATDLRHSTGHESIAISSDLAERCICVSAGPPGQQPSQISHAPHIFATAFSPCFSPARNLKYFRGARCASRISPITSLQGRNSEPCSKRDSICWKKKSPRC
jgi:hypothetical protein